MEWLYLIGAFFLGAYFWDKYKDSQGRQTQYSIPSKQAVPPKTKSEIAKKLNVASIDLADITLSSEQKAVYKTIEETSGNIYVTGKAGTGKSVLLQYFTENSSKQVAVVAPTGVAALNVGGQTIHSFFRFPLDVIDLKEIRVDYKTKEVLKNVEVVVIDEVSMVRVDLMEAINVKLQLARGNDLPFGGVQMVMFGDLYQLPPVVTDGQLQRYFDHTYGGVYFFNAPVYKQTELKIFELDHIFRQKDPEFKGILNAIRCGDSSPKTLSKINTRNDIEIPEEGFITLAGTNAVVSSINHRKLAELSGQSKEYIAEISGDIPESSFPTEKILKLKSGAQIMMLRNDHHKPRRWANGTLGIVTKLGNDSIYVNINGVEHSVMHETWNKYRYYYDPAEKKLDKEAVSSFTQFPIRLAWAITIHKSQGQTYQSVAVDLSEGAFTHGQTYVALSRCKSLEGLFLKSPILKEDVIVDPEVVEFMKQAVIFNPEG